MTSERILLSMSNKLATLSSKASSLKNGLDQNTDKLAPRLNLRIETGGVEIDHQQNSSLVNPDGCIGKRGTISKKIEFTKPFLKPPEVILGLTSFDIRFGQDSRLRLEVNEITENYFKYSLLTWCDTKLSIAKANWMAIGK